jgi:hypothetical protein
MRQIARKKRFGNQFRPVRVIMMALLAAKQHTFQAAAAYLN